MSKTILIGMNNKFSASANRWLFSITGFVFLVNGGLNIFSNNLEPLGLIMGVLMLIGGIYYLFFGLFGFSVNSKLASKVKVDETVIVLKNSLWKPGTTLKWNELSSIKFQSYEIIFQLGDSSYSFSYNANPDVSITIKQTLRELAERKNIQIIDG